VRNAGWLLLALGLAGCSLLPGSTSRTPSPTQPLPTPVVTTVAAPDPEIAMQGYLEAWAAGDYDAMYSMLTPLSQDAMTPDEFKEAYQEVVRSAAVTGVSYQIVSSLMSPQAAQVRYQVTLDSAVVGPITRETVADLKRVDDQWKVAWSSATILPELTGENKLYMQLATLTRANIYDRNGLGLVTQSQAVALWIVPNQIGDEDAEAAMLSVLSRMFDRRPEEIQASYEGFRDTDFFIPLGEVSLDDFQRYEGTLSAVGGVQWRVYDTRFYGSGGLAPQSVGYVGQIQQQDLDTYLARGYQVDDFVGQTGLERAFESELRGTPGGTLYIVDPDGNIVEKLGERDPSPPQAVYTTLDRDLQRQAQQAIAGFNGAIVVLERDTGAIRALVSSPGFDPNLFDTANPNWQYGLNEILNDPNQPLLNRATNGTYPLGSVFKLITMSAALESGVYTPDSTYTCNGFFTEIPGLTLKDWTVDKELPAHGELTLMEGLERSCNPFFWHIGLDLFNQGFTTALPDMAKAFGLGQSTGIEIGDSPGLVPDPDTKKSRTGEDWAGRDSVQLAIGQSFLQVTPLQVARFVAAIGNGGTLFRPQLVDRVQSAEGEVSHTFSPIVDGNLPLKPENLKSLQDAMFLVTSAPNGTASRTLRYPTTFPIRVHGKTGTAESGQADPHAWFVGYTDENRTDKPDLAIVVLAEYQGEGSEWAAPIFRRVVEDYFYGQPFRRYPWESGIGVPSTPTPTPGPEEDVPPEEATPAP
jgi:penicillin-binding protein 2